MRRAAAILAAGMVILTAGIQPASAAKADILYGTTGRCNNPFPGGPCTETSTLVVLDPSTGALARTIGAVGYTVNGLAWDRKSQQLYASTSLGCGVEDSVCPFHGLITIDTATGAGTPVDPVATNFGLIDDESPIHSITIDSAGRMVGWYDEFPADEVTDTFVTIDKTTGRATEFPDTGLQTNQNGLSFNRGNNQLWNIDAPRGQASGTITQAAYMLDPASGKPLSSVSLSPPTIAAIGDFNPANGFYYGLRFQPFDPFQTTSMAVIDLGNGSVTTLGRTVDNLHTLAFAKNVKKLRQGRETAPAAARYPLFDSNAAKRDIAESKKNHLKEKAE
jgi:hypothetical protein